MVEHADEAGFVAAAVGKACNDTGADTGDHAASIFSTRTGGVSRVEIGGKPVYST